MVLFMTVVADENAVCKQLAAEIEKCANNANDIFRVGLSGGSLIKYMCNVLKNIKTDLRKWRFYFCDERYVEEESQDSTFGEYKRLLLPLFPTLTEEQFQTINMQLPLQECAAEYEKRIRDDFNILESTVEPPSFDLLLLGMGPDGHTCSLFPDHQLLGESKRWIAPIENSPKPPPRRITMTLPLINAAKCCLLPVCGAGKADIIKRVLKDKEQLPIALVNPPNGKFGVILDEQANSLMLSKEKCVH